MIDDHLRWSYQTNAHIKLIILFFSRKNMEKHLTNANMTFFLYKSFFASRHLQKSACLWALVPCSTCFCGSVRDLCKGCFRRWSVNILTAEHGFQLKKQPKQHQHNSTYDSYHKPQHVESWHKIMTCDISQHHRLIKHFQPIRYRSEPFVVRSKAPGKGPGRWKRTEPGDFGSFHRRRIRATLLSAHFGIKGINNK